MLRLLPSHDLLCIHILHERGIGGDEAEEGGILMVIRVRHSPAAPIREFLEYGLFFMEKAQARSCVGTPVDDDL